MMVGCCAGNDPNVTNPLCLDDFDVLAVGTKGVSQNHLLSFDDNKVLKIINWIC